MHLEPPHLDFVFPYLVMQLHVVQDCIDETFDVWVLVAQQFQHNLHHLSLMQNNLPGSLEEKELEKGVQYLLYHFVIFLLGS